MVESAGQTAKLRAPVCTALPSICFQIPAPWTTGRKNDDCGVGDATIVPVDVAVGVVVAVPVVVAVGVVVTVPVGVAVGVAVAVPVVVAVGVAVIVPVSFGLGTPGVRRCEP